jgi:hypothetical protein
MYSFFPIVQDFHSYKLNLSVYLIGNRVAKNPDKILDI